MANAAVLDLLEHSQWVIEGTVQKVGATTMPEVPASPNTFVVKVDAILHGPSEFSDHRGRQITLYSDDPKGLAPKESAVFFTRSWLYGRSLAVIEVGRVPKGDGDTVARDVKAAEQAAFDHQLRARIAAAKLVVSGKVTDVRQGPEPRRPVETEHHPDWATAIFAVDQALKGTPPGPTIEVVFPRSMDEMWIDSPKFKKGMAAILILQQNQKEKGWPVLRVPGFTALHPLDRQPASALNRVRQLVGGTT